MFARNAPPIADMRIQKDRVGLDIGNQARQLQMVGLGRLPVQLGRAIPGLIGDEDPHAALARLAGQRPQAVTATG